MRFLRSLGRGAITCVWIFNMVMIRMIVLFEVFTLLFAGSMALHMGLGVTMGQDVAFMPWHRGLFLAALPVICAISGTAFGQIRRRLICGTADTATVTSAPGSPAAHLARNHFLLLALINFGVLQFMAAAWPESALAATFPAAIMALAMSGASTLLSSLLSITALEQPPYPRQ